MEALCLNRALKTRRTPESGKYSPPQAEIPYGAATGCFLSHGVAEAASLCSASERSPQRCTSVHRNYLKPVKCGLSRCFKGLITIMYQKMHEEDFVRFMLYSLCIRLSHRSLELRCCILCPKRRYLVQIRCCLKLPLLVRISIFNER